MGNGPRTATLDYNEAYGAQIQESFSQIPEYDRSWMVLGMDRGSTFGGFGMVPVSERDRSQAEVQPEVQAILSKVAGMSTVVFPRSSVPGGGGGLPIQFVLSSDRPHSEIVEVADAMIGEAMGSGRFMFLRKSVEMDLPVTRVVIDRDRAADLSLTMADIGRGLGVMLGGGYVNQFSMDGNSYKVIPQVERDFRVQADQLGSYFVRGSDGTMVPLSTVVTLEQGVEPSTRSQFQQLNSVTLEGVPKVPEGEALAYLDDLATRILPQGYVVNYSGDSRQFMQQGSVLVFTFFMSLLVIYLVLAAQFESWRDPLIILVSVPLATAGALAFITLGFSSINIYTQVGLITLIGVVAKNGILIVEFANQLQIHEGMSKREAVEQASAIRLRPILMTSAAMILAMVPLLIASGPGAVSRFDIGLTIAAGLGIGTLFTLFILPAFYLWLARDHSLHRQPEVAV
jgi:multidrug efflux pump